MRRVLCIAGLTLGFFFLEFFLFHLLGSWFKPNFLLLLIVFFNLYLGIRYSLLTAFTAGVLKDSFGLHAFGLYTFAFVLCAFLTTIVRKYLFHTSAYSFRILLAFSLSMFQVLVVWALYSLFTPVDPNQVLRYVLAPEVIPTTLIASYTFFYLKRCVLKFSV